MEEFPEKEQFQSGENVAVKRGTTLAMEIRGRGRSYPLSNTFEVKQLGSDRFSEIYFRTRTNNIYLINEFGFLINANASRRKGEIYASKLSKRERQDKILTVGKPFTYGKDGATTEVTEIVAVTSKHYGPNSDELHRLTNGITNSIAEEFRKGMPKDLDDFLMNPQ